MTAITIYICYYMTGACAPRLHMNTMLIPKYNAIANQLTLNCRKCITKFYEKTLNGAVTLRTYCFRNTIVIEHKPPNVISQVKAKCPRPSVTFENSVQQQCPGKRLQGTRQWRKVATRVIAPSPMPRARFCAATRRQNVRRQASADGSPGRVVIWSRLATT